MERYHIVIEDRETGNEHTVSGSLFALVACDETGCRSETAGNASILKLAAMRDALSELRSKVEDEVNKLLSRTKEEIAPGEMREVLLSLMSRLFGDSE